MKTRKIQLFKKFVCYSLTTSKYRVVTSTSTGCTRDWKRNFVSFRFLRCRTNRSQVVTRSNLSSTVALSCRSSWITCVGTRFCLDVAFGSTSSPARTTNGGRRESDRPKRTSYWAWIISTPFSVPRGRSTRSKSRCTSTRSQNSSQVSTRLLKV